MSAIILGKAIGRMGLVSLNLGKTQDSAADVGVT